MRNLQCIMPRRRLPFPFNLFHKDDNGMYRVECKKCGWEKSYRVFNGTIWHAPGTKVEQYTVKTWRELPKSCPECGAKTKNRKLPWPITWKF